MAFRPRILPADILHTIFENLTDSRRDLHAATLVNWEFNRAATVYLYRTLDTWTRLDRQEVSTSLLCALSLLDRFISLAQLPIDLRPQNTILRRPELARHVRHIQG